MPDYIKREDLESNVDEALRLLDADNTAGDLDYAVYCELHDAICMIADPAIPAADVVEVVRCKDCLYWQDIGVEGICHLHSLHSGHKDVLGEDATYTQYHSGAWFCADGERKEDDHETD